LVIHTEGREAERPSNERSGLEGSAENFSNSKQKNACGGTTLSNLGGLRTILEEKKAQDGWRSL